MQDGRGFGSSKENKQAWAEEVEAEDCPAASVSLFALYTIPISSTAGHSVGFELVMEDFHNFVTHKLAEELQLPSKTTVAKINLVGGQGTVTITKVYNMCLSDKQGRRYQVDDICMVSLLAISPAPETEYLVNRSHKHSSYGPCVSTSFY